MKTRLMLGLCALFLLSFGSSVEVYGQVPGYVPTDGLVAWWNFDGNTTDEMGAFELQSETAYGQDRFGNQQRALDVLNSPSGPLNFGDSITAFGDWSSCSISLWSSLENAGQYNHFIQHRSAGNGNLHFVLSNNNEGFYAYHGSSNDSLLLTDVSPPTDTWFMLTWTLSCDPDSTRSTLYLNGEIIGQKAFGLGCLTSLDSDVLYIGGGADTVETVKGLVDDVGIWDRVLSMEEIDALYAAPAPIPGCTDAVACNFNPEAFFDDASCIYLDLNVPTVCDATGMLECSALVEGIDAPNNTIVNGYDYHGTFGESDYYLSQASFYAPSGWHEQNDFAQSLGGHLADIHSEEENQFIYDFIAAAGSTKGAWIGLSDEAYEGVWAWTSGTPVTFTAWHEGQPDNHLGQEDWVHLVGSSATWNDNRSQLAMPCVIELPSLPSVMWSNDDYGATTSYPISATSLSATLVIDGVEVCTAYHNIEVGQGCNDPAACNYSENDSCNVSCLYVLDGVDCGLVGSSVCGEGTVWDEPSQTCIVATPSDSNFDGCVQLNDLLGILSVYGMCFDSGSCESVSYQGYNYKTVQIGEQCWFAENLRAEHFTNGQPITEVQASADWQQLSSGARAVVGDNAGISAEEYNANLEAFGRIYNGYAVMDPRGLCPSGWHIATQSDWNEMQASLEIDADGIAGSLLKSSEFDVPPWDGTNESGWSGLPGGNRGSSGTFNQVNNYGYWWTSTVEGELNGETWLLTRQLATENDALIHFSTTLPTGNSIRCIEDLE